MRLSSVAPALVAGALVLVPLAGPLAATAYAAAPAATSTDPTRIGLYGSQDPTYDGVYRQSLALLALDAAGEIPAPAAVAWLLAQQCADGGFQAFRASLSTPCTAPSSTAFSGEDSNSTGIAVQALHALGKATEAGRAADWLTAHQAGDGGWPYYPDGASGNASDANSTALGLSALLSLGRAIPTAGGHTPYDALQALQVGCEGATADRGAFTFFGAANDYATVQATLAVAGGFLPVPPTAGDDDAPVLLCPAAQPRALTDVTPAQSADYAAGYLVRRLAANDHVVPDPFNPGQTDWSSTANAVLALVGAGHGSTEVAAALVALEAGQAAYTTKAGADLPGSLALLTLTAHAGGTNPTSFGGTNLVARLAATLTVAAATPTPTPTTGTPAASPSGSVAATVAASDPTLPPTGGGAGTPYLALSGVALLGAGVLLVATSRRLLPAGRHGGDLGREKR